MSDKKIIQDLQHQRLELKCQIDTILDKYLGPDEGQWHVIGEWECIKSPIGLCVYNIMDRMKDHCFFCNCPQERK